MDPNVGKFAAEKKSSDDPALDFLSEQFDAEKALATPGLEPPDPCVRPLDNVSKCRHILPPDLPESLANMVSKKSSEEARQKTASFKERAARLAQRVQDSCTMSLDRVIEYVKPGPLRLMSTWLEQGRRVRVVTRHARGVRGTATGVLTAYDRYMNVILRDVYEEYTVRVRVARVKQVPIIRPCTGSVDDNPVEAGETGEAVSMREKVRWCHKQEHRSRTLGQIMIKGDNIVVISLEEQCKGGKPQVQDQHQSSTGPAPQPTRS
mmetsp:Transcript_26478/g.57767  ORF Transcript_26478/g.57767 Transcript_26478/m.57767 type:complete len:264 (-) Transcript_26478:34-825(-)